MSFADNVSMDFYIYITLLAAVVDHIVEEAKELCEFELLYNEMEMELDEIEEELDLIELDIRELNF